MLTLSEIKTFDYIKRFITSNNHAPTTAEIAKGIGISSRGVVHRYLKALEKKGYIKLMPRRHRNILLQDRVEEVKHSIPLLGKIAAGNPIEAAESKDTIDVTRFFLGNARYALRVTGDSMMDDGIHNNDIIICERSDSAENGQIVVALINKQEATLKRLFNKGKETVTLLPANPNYQAQTYKREQVEIQGVYIGLLRLA